MVNCTVRPRDDAVKIVVAQEHRFHYWHSLYLTFFVGSNSCFYGTVDLL